MRKLLIGLLVCASACTMNDSNNQRNSRPKTKQGPRAKNTHWWKRTVPQTVARRRNARQWGGVVKNERPGSKKSATDSQTLVRRKKQVLKGPRAKNRRP